jgi:hypothetical protein
MKEQCAILIALLAFPTAQAQTTSGSQTIEGYWQDIAGRTTFKRNVSPGSTYGAWNVRELDATYPQAKKISRAGTTFDLADLNYDEKEYSVKVVRADAGGISFVRKANWSSCRMQHDCRLAGAEMLCSIETLCQEDGKDVVDWRGEERYIRRAACERDGRAQLQGIPVKCR